MNLQLSKFLVFILIFLAGPSWNHCLAASDNPHVIAVESNTQGCTNCHPSHPVNANKGKVNSKNYHHTDPQGFAKDGVEMCTECHSADDGHKVGLELDFDIPADLPLGKKNKMTCLTCHFVHGDLESEKPQASVSFMDRMVNAERLHKSYLLRRNNSDGELCLICHDTSNKDAK